MSSTGATPAQRGEIENRLILAGLTAAEARRKRELFESLDKAWGGASAPRAHWFVPGRVELLGKHTDYAGGRSLLCAVGRGFCVAAAPRPDAVLRVVDAGRNLTAEVALDPALVPSASGWRVFLETIASRLARNFPGLRGADVALASDLPRASGLSSSSALVVSLFTALADMNSLAERAEYRSSIRSPEEIGEYLGALENGRPFGELAGEHGVGTFGGSEDPTAIVCSEAGRVAQFAFCPVRRERSVRLPDGWTLVVASSGVASDKTGDARDRFNRLSIAARAILDLWNRSAHRQDTTLLAAATASPDSAERIRNLLRLIPVEGDGFTPEYLTGRFDQFLEESTVLVPQVGDWLARDEVVPIGPLVDRSQELAETRLKNQIPETVALHRSGRSLGAAAASAFGGGFGGSVWAVVRSEEADAFRKRWGEAYAQAFPNPTGRSRFFATQPGPSVTRL